MSRGREEQETVIRFDETDPGVVDLHVAVQRLACRVDHRPPELVQQHPGRFVPKALPPEGGDSDV